MEENVSFMKKYPKFLIFLFLAAILVGCASGGPKFSTMQSTIPQLNPEMARIYFYRKSVFGALIKPMVFVNGRNTHKAKSKGFFYVDVEPGEALISVNTEVTKKITLRLEKGDVRYVSLIMKMGLVMGRMFPTQVDEEKGIKDMRKLVYIGDA